MRKLIYSLFLLLCTAFVWTGCQEEDPVATEKFKVTFDSKGGSAVAEMVIEKGEKITKPTNPTNGEYLFVDWFKDDGYLKKWDFDKDVVESDMTLYAKWTTITYTVTFNTNGGNTIEPATVAKGAPAIKPVAPTKEGAAFDNWYKEAALANVYDFSTPVTANITLYAKWTTVTREMLIKLLDEARSIVAYNYTKESYSAMNAKADDAYAALQNESSTPAQILKAYTDLSAAMNALVALPKREVADLSVGYGNVIDGVVYVNPEQDMFSLYAYAMDGKGSQATDSRVTFEYDATKLATWAEGEIRKTDNSIDFTIKKSLTAGQTISVTIKSAENPAISKTITLKVAGKEEVTTLFLNAVNALPAPNQVSYEHYEAIEKARNYYYYALTWEQQQRADIKAALEKVAQCENAYWDLPTRIKYSFSGNICTLISLDGSDTDNLGKFNYTANGAFPAGTYESQEWMENEDNTLYQVRLIVKSDGTGMSQVKEQNSDWGDDETFTYTFQGSQAEGGMFFITFERNEEVPPIPIPSTKSMKGNTVRGVFKR